MTDIPKYIGLTRTYYFNGQLLNVNSFMTDQRYVRDLTYNQNLALVTSGVIEGLEVSVADGKLQVSPGAAMCAAGMMVFFPDTKSFSDFSELTTGKKYALILQYADNSRTDAATLQVSQVITETFNLTTAASGQDPTGREVVLATFEYQSGGPASVDMTSAAGRKQAEMKLQPAQSGPQKTVAAVAKQASPQTAKTTAAPQSGAANGFANPYEQPLTIGGKNSLGGWLNIDAKLTASGQTSALAVSLSGDAPVPGDIKFGNLHSAKDFSLMSANLDNKDTLYVDGTGQIFSQGDASVLTGTSNVSDPLKTLAKAQTVLTTPAVTGTQRYAVMGSSLSGTPAVYKSGGGQSLVSYDALVVLLVAAVNELNDRITALEAKK